ncbi:MAG: hypothetical protein B7Z52_02515, partial [Burkholderiales bacterium 12-64-5]
MALPHDVGSNSRGATAKRSPRRPTSGAAGISHERTEGDAGQCPLRNPKKNNRRGCDSHHPNHSGGSNMKEDMEAPRPAFEETSALYKVWLLVLLVLVYACSFLDRIVIAVLARPIKAELGLSDFQVGLLGGLAFALIYTVAGLPLGRLAERAHRVRLISVCIIIWSAFAALCGMAANFWQMVLFRAGVGIGEAGCTPAAHSLIGDQYPPHRRATALAIYAL